MNQLTADDSQILRALLTRHRWAALATSRDGEPLASWVAAARDDVPATWLLHLSRLALHTRHLEVNPRASLAFSEADIDPARDPQTLARVSLHGAVSVIEPASAAYGAARARYLGVLPHAAVQFGLGDFRLMRFTASHARFVSGFGRAHRLDRAALLEHA